MSVQPYTALGEFPDVVDGLMTWAEAQWPQQLVGNTGEDTPVDLQGRDFFLVVRLLTGQDDKITDVSTYDVEVFARTRAAARALSEAIRSELSVYPPVVGGVVLDDVYTETRPRELPWAGENTRRYGATYQISTRRRV